MLPVLAATGAAAIRGLPALASRLGIASKVGSVINFARSNPSTFLLAAKETYDQGVSVYDQLVAVDPEGMAALLKSATAQMDALATLVAADSVDSGVIEGIDSLEDEMDCIDDAVRALGSFDNLQTLRRALTMTDKHFAMYLRLKRLTKRIR